MSLLIETTVHATLGYFLLWRLRKDEQRGLSLGISLMPNIKETSTQAYLTVGLTKTCK